MKPILQNEINMLGQRNNLTNPNYMSSRNIIKFVKLAKSTIGIFIDDDTTVQKLLSLLQSAAASTIDDRNNMLLKSSSIMDNLNRSKRSIDEQHGGGNKVAQKRDANIDVMHLTLEMSETLMNSNNKTVVLMEKQRLPEYILSFMQKICVKQQFVSKIFGNITIDSINFILHFALFFIF